MSISQLLSSTTTEVLATTIRQERDIQGTQIAKESNYHLFTDGVIMNVQSPEDSIRNFLETINL